MDKIKTFKKLNIQFLRKITNKITIKHIKSNIDKKQ